MQTVADILFTTFNQSAVDWLNQQCAKGRPISVNRREWHGRAYVLKVVPVDIDPVAFPSPRKSWRVTLRPTGAPRQGNFPSPPAGTIVRHIYTSPYTGERATSIIIDDPQAPVHAMKDNTWWTKRLVDDAVLRGSINFDGLSVSDALAKITRTINHPNCRCTPIGITSKEKRMKVRNKFYVAAPSVTNSSEQAQDNTSDKVHLSMTPNDRSGKWTRKDLKDALAHGEAMLAGNPNLEHVAIVKIVKIVRRPKPKFVIEDVK